MIPLLKRDRLGQVVSGSDEALLTAARGGDDIVAFEKSSIFTCHIGFANYVVSRDRVSGLSLPHMAFGDLRDEERLRSNPAEIIYYIYDSMCNNLLCKDVPDEGRTTTEVFGNNPHYAGLTWYSTRRFAPAGYLDAESIRRLGDQFKLRLTLVGGLHIVVRPDIIYFPDDDRHFLVKSSAMILPTAFAADPDRYVETSRPLIANTSFGVSYLNVDSKGALTIIHTPRFSLGEKLIDALERICATPHPVAPFVGGQSDHGGTLTTRVSCDYQFLLPAVEGATA